MEADSSFGHCKWVPLLFATNKMKIFVRIKGKTDCCQVYLFQLKSAALGRMKAVKFQSGDM